MTAVGFRERIIRAILVWTLVFSSATLGAVVAGPAAAEQTSSVSIYRVTCGGGATTSISIPINAWSWHARLGYYRANGSRIGWSGVWDSNRSFYPGYVVAAQFVGRIPAGTRDLRAFWWYDGAGNSWWNQVRIAC